MSIARAKIVRDDCKRVLQAMDNSAALSGLEKATVLISGGTGFLGSWISSFLAYLSNSQQLGIKVIIVARDSERFASLAMGLEGFELEFIKADVRSLKEIPKSVNYIIHTAAIPDSRFHFSNPLETMSTIAAGTQAILQAATRCSDLRMIIHLSSGSVYGTQPETTVAISERQDLTSIPLDSVKSAYIEAKRYAEVLCAMARTELRLPVIVLRPFTFVGPFQSLGAPWAINNFLNDGINGRPIRILGNGQAIRGFLYGADVAAWIVKLLAGGRDGQVYNVGSQVGHTLQYLAEKIAGCFKPKLNVLLNASLVPTEAPNRYLADITALSNDHQLKQYTDLDFAIEQTIKWHLAK